MSASVCVCVCVCARVRAHKRAHRRTHESLRLHVCVCARAGACPGECVCARTHTRCGGLSRRGHQTLLSLLKYQSQHRPHHPILYIESAGMSDHHSKNLLRPETRLGYTASMTAASQNFIVLGLAWCHPPHHNTSESITMLNSAFRSAKV